MILAAYQEQFSTKCSPNLFLIKYFNQNVKNSSVNIEDVQKNEEETVDKFFLKKIKFLCFLYLNSAGRLNCYYL